MAEIIASTYKIIGQIGAGGGGIVYLAEHLRLRKKVILKADKRKITTRQDLLRREVDILKELSHTYIPQVYDYFAEGDVVYTVMDYIEGESLDRPLKRGETFSQAQVIFWAKELLQALDYLHRPIHGNPPRGYVHSDIKPANIMRKPNGDICLIDFNIALALGELSAIGCSNGYASPEHYGLDFSTGGSTVQNQERGAGGTEILDDVPERSRSRQSSQSGYKDRSSGRKNIVPDVRSDIYSVGATLYHLLSGVRPNKNAMEVEPLSSARFSPQIVTIITKAMNPNPELRYQSAQEMLDAFVYLHQNDRRAIRWRRRDRCAYSFLALMLAGGVASAFVGTRRMQDQERWLRMTKDAEKQLEDGDAAGAAQAAMEIYHEQEEAYRPTLLPQTRKVLTDALGVYELSEGFHPYKTVTLPSAPLGMQISPEGTTAACLCAGELEVLDLEQAECIEHLPMVKSALAEMEYLTEDKIVYAGADGITAYDLTEKKVLWKGEAATSISVSEDGTTVAAVYRDQDFAILYDAETGNQKTKIEFLGRGQQVAVNDVFLNPSDNVFCLNQDGSLLAVSFSDGSFSVFKTQKMGEDQEVEIFDNTSGYSHYEGGFYQKYLAFSATTGKKEDSVFAVVDMEKEEQVGGFSSEGYYSAAADKDGILAGIDNILVQMDPQTGDQIPLVDTAERISQYARDGKVTAVSANGKIYFFDENAKEMSSSERDIVCNILKIRNGTAVIGGNDSPEVWIMKYEKHEDQIRGMYEGEYAHDEARLSADGKTEMLFSYDHFGIFDLEGNKIVDKKLPDADQVYDQQFRRDGEKSFLEVTYNDGTVEQYSAADGELIDQKNTDAPNTSLDEVFETSRFRIESPLHGKAVVYDKASGKQVKELEEDAYLTYVTEMGDYLIAQYMTTDYRYYGYLMDQNCQILGYLPQLCDAWEDTLFFDDGKGSIRESKIYELEELWNLAQTVE